MKNSVSAMTSITVNVMMMKLEGWGNGFSKIVTDLREHLALS